MPISQCMKNRGKQIQINSINLLTINHLDWDDIFLYISKKSHLFAIFVT